VLGPEIVHQTTEKINMIQEKMKASQSRHKGYHDKRRKALEFQEGDHMFFRVTPVTGVGRALNSKAHAAFYWSVPDFTEDKRGVLSDCFVAAN
jgi:hypothetical protein